MKFKYKKYIGIAEYDDELDEYHGSVIGIRDGITFGAKNKEDLENAFKESVEDYIEFCKETGKIPEKSYSGEFVVRINPEIHSKIALNAMYKGKSLNSYIEEILKNTLKLN